MKRKIDVRSLAAGVLLGAAAVFTVAAAGDKRTSWEYTTHYYNASHPDVQAINKLGNEGWEMVGHFAGAEGKYPGFVFKRER